MRTVPLDELARGTVAADGTCEITIGPVRRQTWNVANIGVQCLSSVIPPAAPTAKVYLGPSKLGQYISGTYDGVGDNVPTGISLPQGARVTVVWEDGDPGASCIVTLNGTMEVFG